MKKHISSLFQQRQESAQRLQMGEASATPTATVQNEAELQAVIYQGMRQFTPKFIIRYTGDTKRAANAIEAAMKRAIEKDDYIEGTIAQHGYSYEGYEGDLRITITLSYNTTAQKEQVVQQEVRRIIASIITGDMREVEKVQAINEWLVLNTSYSKQTKGNPHAAHTLFTEHEGVCQAYAMAAYALLKQAGLRAHYVTGSITRNSELHAWNTVQVDGQWYHLDVTWNDPTFKDGVHVEDYISYDYFLCSDRAIQKTRTIDWKPGHPRATSERFQAVTNMSSVLLQVNGKRYMLTPVYYKGYLYSIVTQGKCAYTLQRLCLHAAVPAIEEFIQVKAFGLAASETGLYIIDGQRMQQVSYIDVATRHFIPLSTPAVTHLRIEGQEVVGYDGKRAVWQQSVTAMPKEQTVTPTVNVRYVNTVSGAVLREQPMKGSRALQVVPQHTAIQVHRIEGQWVHATVNGVQGYMLQDKLRT